MYNIAKISVNSWNTDGSTVYDKYIYCENFKEVLEALKCENADYMYGKGSDILDKDNEVIFNTDDYKQLSADCDYDSSKAITLKALKIVHIETKEYYKSL